MDNHRRHHPQPPNFGLYASSEKAPYFGQERFAPPPHQRSMQPAVVSPTYLLPNIHSSTIPGSPLHPSHLQARNPRHHVGPATHARHPQFAYGARELEGPVTLNSPGNGFAAAGPYHRGAAQVVRPSPSMQMHPSAMAASPGSPRANASIRHAQSPRLPQQSLSKQSPRRPQHADEDLDLATRVATLEGIVAAQGTQIEEQNKRLCHQAAELSEAKGAMSDQIAMYRSIAKISMARAEAVGALDIRDSSVEALSDDDSAEAGLNGIGNGNGGGGGIEVTPAMWAGSKPLVGRKRLRSDESVETG